MNAALISLYILPGFSNVAPYRLLNDKAPYT